MKVLHIIDSGGLYGAETMLLSLMIEQSRMGLQPVLASIGTPYHVEKPIEAEARRCGIQVVPFRMWPGPNLAGAIKILRFAWQVRAQVLHSHGYKGNILLGALPRTIRKIPLVATVHGWTWTRGVNRMKFYEWLDSMSLPFIDRVVLVDVAMKNHPRLRHLHRIAHDVVENGISLHDSVLDLDIYGETMLALSKFCQEGYVIGAIGRLSREKGFDLLLEAFANLARELCDIRLVLLGDGPLQEELERKIRERGLSARVLMAGYVRNARQYLHFFHLLVLPSLTEGLPIVLLEAMQAGVPIVASEVGGIPHALDSGRAGFLCEPGSVEQLVQGIRSAVDNPGRAEKQAETAQQRVDDIFSARTMALKYRDIYRRVSSGRNDAVREGH